MPNQDDQIEIIEARPRVGVAVKERTEIKPQRPHIVIVWNDEEHSLEFVVEVLCKVCGMNTEQAVASAIEIHEKGKAIVWRGHKEHAELKREQIATFRDVNAVNLLGAPNIPLNVTIESE